MIEREDELMALVADVGGAIAIWRGLHYNLLISLTLAFIGIQDLEYLWDFFGICTVNIGLSDRSDMKQLIDVQGHERVGLLSVKLSVVEQDLFTAHHYIFFVPAKPLCVLGRK